MDSIKKSVKHRGPNRIDDNKEIATQLHSLFQHPENTNTLFDEPHNNNENKHEFRFPESDSRLSITIPKASHLDSARGFEAMYKPTHKNMTHRKRRRVSVFVKPKISSLPELVEMSDASTSSRNKASSTPRKSMNRIVLDSNVIDTCEMGDDKNERAESLYHPMKDRLRGTVLPKAPTGRLTIQNDYARRKKQDEYSHEFSVLLLGQTLLPSKEESKETQALQYRSNQGETENHTEPTNTCRREMEVQDSPVSEKKDLTLEQSTQSQVQPSVIQLKPIYVGFSDIGEAISNEDGASKHIANEQGERFRKFEDLDALTQKYAFLLQQRRCLLHTSENIEENHPINGSIVEGTNDMADTYNSGSQNKSDTAAANDFEINSSSQPNDAVELETETNEYLLDTSISRQESSPRSDRQDTGSYLQKELESTTLLAIEQSERQLSARNSMSKYHNLERIGSANVIDNNNSDTGLEMTVTEPSVSATGHDNKPVGTQKILKTSQKRIRQQPGEMLSSLPFARYATPEIQLESIEIPTLDQLEPQTMPSSTSVEIHEYSETQENRRTEARFELAGEKIKLSLSKYGRGSAILGSNSPTRPKSMLQFHSPSTKIITRAPSQIMFLESSPHENKIAMIQNDDNWDDRVQPAQEVATSLNKSSSNPCFEIDVNKVSEEAGRTAKHGNYSGKLSNEISESHMPTFEDQAPSQHSNPKSPEDTAAPNDKASGLKQRQLSMLFIRKKRKVSIKTMSRKQSVIQKQGVASSYNDANIDDIADTTKEEISPSFQHDVRDDENYPDSLEIRSPIKDGVQFLLSENKEGLTTPETDSRVSSPTKTVALRGDDYLPQSPGMRLRSPAHRSSGASSDDKPDSPAIAYTRMRRKSTIGTQQEVVDDLNESTEFIGSVMPKPSIGIAALPISEVPENEIILEKLERPDSEQGDLTSRRIISQALAANGFSKDGLLNLFDVVHTISRRRQGMSAVERSKYPTFTDPGPPLDESGTPILLDNGEEAPSTITNADMLRDIERLDSIIESSPFPIPTNLRKRAALLAAVGSYSQAMDDLNSAIQLDPFHSDSYWHRSQLFLRLNDAENALRDLDAITENNKSHLGAFQTKARIYQALGIIKLAIINYSTVIRLRPDNADAFYNRASLFEAENEHVYANEDFRMVRQLDPTNEYAIYNLAKYNFQKQLWGDSIQSFTKLIILNPENAQALAYRGRAYASIAKYEEALEDLTEAIRIVPNNASFFFYRGCLLRDRNPSKAIDDFSVSILIDDTVANSNAIFKRAQLYHQQGRHDLAIADYTNVIDLDPTKAKAYLNLGVLLMRYFAEYDKALEYLNKSIANDPVSVKAYLCRAELYQLMHTAYLADIAKSAGTRRTTRVIKNPTVQNVDKAIKDYTKTIHLCPNNYILYLYRGRLLLKQNMMSEATFDFHAAFELNASIAQTFIQRALVLSFQRKYRQIIEEYDDRRRYQVMDDPGLLLLVAKARIRCGDYKGALQDLRGATDMNRNDPQVYLQRGICHEHLHDWESASEEFSKCLELMPSFAKAYYHRALCKLHSGNDGGIIDLDLAIQHDSKFFDAYLTRANFYHERHDYDKAIEDCNHALKLEPTSIRSHLLRGTSRCKLGNYQSAIHDFTKAIYIDRTNHYAYYNRAMTYQLLEDYDNAIRDYSIVLLLYQDANAYRNRGLIYWKKGDRDNALLDIIAAREAAPLDPKLRTVLGLCLHKMGQNVPSINEFNDALSIQPNMIEALLGRGNVKASMGHLNEARRDYAKAFHMFPRCAQALINFAFTLQTENRLKKALDVLTAAIMIDPVSSAAHEGRSVVQMSLGAHFAALADISKATDLSSKNSEYFVIKGVVLQAIKNQVSALSLFKSALSFDPKNSLAYYNAANIYLRQRLWEEAIKFYDNAVDLMPTNKSFVMNRGIAKFLLKDINGSLIDLEHARSLAPDCPHVTYNLNYVMQKRRCIHPKFKFEA